MLGSFSLHLAGDATVGDLKTISAKQLLEAIICDSLKLKNRAHNAEEEDPI